MLRLASALIDCKGPPPSLSCSDTLSDLARTVLFGIQSLRGDCIAEISATEDILFGNHAVCAAFGGSLRLVAALGGGIGRRRLINQIEGEEVSRGF